MTFGWRAALNRIQKGRVIWTAEEDVINCVPEWIKDNKHRMYKISPGDMRCAGKIHNTVSKNFHIKELNAKKLNDKSEMTDISQGAIIDYLIENHLD